MNDFLAGIGLGAVGDQLKDLRLSELLETLPPGVDEAVAISKVSPYQIHSTCPGPCKAA